MPPPSLPPFAFRIGRLITYQTLHRNNLPEPLLGRFGKMTTPTAVRRNIVLHRTHRGDLRAVADLEMVVDTDLRAQRNIVADRQTAREPDLGRQQAVPADGHIVTDLDLIVDFGALSDHCVAKAAAVDRRSRPDLDVVLDHHAACLRHLQMAIGAEEQETITVLPDAAAGMNQDVVADQRALNRRARAESL